MNNRFVETLTRLYQKTIQGGLKWQPTADEDKFRIGLGEGIVRVERWHSRRDDEDHWVVRLFGRDGREVESVQTSAEEPTPGLEFVPDLFQQARRSALDIDSLLASIDKDIEAGTTVEISEAEKGDDDIPF